MGHQDLAQVPHRSGIVEALVGQPVVPGEQAERLKPGIAVHGFLPPGEKLGLSEGRFFATADSGWLVSGIVIRERLSSPIVAALSSSLGCSIEAIEHPTADTTEG